MRIVLSKVQGRREPAISQVVDQVADRLRQVRIRLTSGRRKVVDALTRVRGPVSAADIHTRLDSSVPLSSIYRTLSVLAETEVVSPHHGRDGVTRYELAEPLQQHHHHLVCVECGRIDDVEFDGQAEVAVDTIVTKVASGREFTVGAHTLEIEGLCEQCS